jgi:hypothetical protein
LYHLGRLRRKRAIRQQSVCAYLTPTTWIEHSSTTHRNQERSLGKHRRESTPRFSSDQDTTRKHKDKVTNNNANGKGGSDQSQSSTATSRQMGWKHNRGEASCIIAREIPQLPPSPQESRQAVVQRRSPSSHGRARGNGDGAAGRHRAGPAGAPAARLRPPVHHLQRTHEPRGTLISASCTRKTARSAAQANLAVIRMHSSQQPTDKHARAWSRARQPVRTGAASNRMHPMQSSTEAAARRTEASWRLARWRRTYSPPARHAGSHRPAHTTTNDIVSKPAEHRASVR